MNNETPRWVYVAGVVLALIAIGGIIDLLGIGDDAEAPRPTPTATTTPVDESPSRGYASVICERAVEDRLVSPSSADFGRPTITGTGRTLDVVGHVDTENTFGATVRVHYDCRVTGTGDDLTVTSIQLYD